MNTNTNTDTNNILEFNYADGSWKFHKNSIANIVSLKRHDEGNSLRSHVDYFYYHADNKFSILNSCIEKYKRDNNIA